ncbi:PA0069 family radical SAM protein [Tistrella bauzanensis]
MVARRALARNDSPDIPFDASINPYRGCEHGCIYCYARPSHAYLGLSPGLDFETIIEVKRGLADALLADLARPGYQPSPITIGGNTDPYQPAEKTERLTRAVIEVLTRHRHPFTIITKSALVLRDIDLLAPAAAAGLAQVAVSVTTLDPALARAMEPRAATPARRIHAIRGLAAAGIPVTVMAAPMVPGLTDHELEAILAAAADAGAVRAGWILLRLPREIAGLFDEWLRLERPDRAERVLARIRATRGGALYDSGFGRRMTGTGTEAVLIADRFRLACARLGLNRTSWRLTSALFTPPSAPPPPSVPGRWICSAAAEPVSGAAVRPFIAARARCPTSPAMPPGPHGRPGAAERDRRRCGRSRVRSPALADRSRWRCSSVARP